MLEQGFHIELANWAADERDLRAVRTAVFIIEQAIPPEEEWDALDAPSLHAIARDETGRAVGVARLTPDHKIGRLAVLKEWRGRHVGDALLRTLIEQARAKHWPSVSLNAQSYAIPFYAKAGFIVDGEEFMEAGIPHRLMTLELAPNPPATRAGDALGARPGSIRIDVTTREECTAAVDQLVADARHKLWIYTRDLDRLLYDRESFIASVRRIALSGRGAEVRILIHDASDAVRDSHRLLHLAARLPTYIVLRTPVDEDRQYPSAFLLNDIGGFLLRPIGSRYEGEGQTAAPGPQASLLNYFNQVWERAEPDPELRRVSV
jgi:predicted GNAT family N-acyltransferase